MLGLPSRVAMKLCLFHINPEGFKGVLPIFFNQLCDHYFDRTTVRLYKIK